MPRALASPAPRHHRATLLAPLAAAILLAGCASDPLPPWPRSEAAPTPAAPANAVADDASVTRSRFESWVADFQLKAQAAGISDATLHAAFDNVHLLPRVIELDRSQPEFTRAPWDYIDSIVSPQRVANGESKLLDARAAADAAASRYGVPAEVLAAVWGIESNFGADYGSTPTIDALATLGFDGRREAWARTELMAALKILQEGDIDRAHMVGSWAGAMGQTQLMPSNFLTYAVDADGDGRRDIWNDLPDVFASTANFLARSGWRPDEPWGVEVRLPAGFDVGRADGTRAPASQWAADGVLTYDGAPLPAIAEGELLLPAGARGPAFLVGVNFRAILRYNNSTNYALAVGLLSQRLAGGPGVQAPWPRDLAILDHAQLQALQAALAQRGFDPGPPDGKLGPATRDALRRWQRSTGLPADGYPTLDVLQRLQGAPATPAPTADTTPVPPPPPTTIEPLPQDTPASVPQPEPIPVVQ